jgi:membrane-associated phospholipid phosphatase
MSEDLRHVSHISRGDTRLGPKTPLIGAAACLLGLALVWVCAALIGPLHREDAVLLQWFSELEHPRVDKAATAATKLLDPLAFVIWSVVLVGFALARRRPRIAVAVAAILSLAPLTTELLKSLLAHRHAPIGRGLYVPAASLPSGHSTAALALALGAVLVVPRGLRPVIAALGALFALGIGFCQLVLARHMPSDVLAGYLVAGFWTTLVIAGVRASESRQPYRT